MKRFNVSAVVKLDLPVKARDLKSALKIVEGIFQSGRMPDGSAAWSQLDWEYGYSVFDEDFNLIVRK